MKHKLFAIIIGALFCYNAADAQGLAVNTTGTAADASAMLDVNATDKGVLVPRMTAAQKNAISSPAIGLLLYQTDSVAGFYYHTGNGWQALGGSGFNDTLTSNLFTNNHLLSNDGTTGIELYGNGIYTDTGTFSAGSNLTVSGAGTRMLWYPKKAAFRAGYVADSNWNDDSIGAYSFAAGYNTRASGQYAIAMGEGAKASGTIATAMGESTTASGSSTTAMGFVTIASGDYATAMGYQTFATG